MWENRWEVAARWVWNLKTGIAQVYTSWVWRYTICTALPRGRVTNFVTAARSNANMTDTVWTLQAVRCTGINRWIRTNITCWYDDMWRNAATCDSISVRGKGALREVWRASVECRLYHNWTRAVTMRCMRLLQQQQQQLQQLNAVSQPSICKSSTFGHCERRTVMWFCKADLIKHETKILLLRCCSDELQVTI